METTSFESLNESLQSADWEVMMPWDCNDETESDDSEEE